MHLLIFKAALSLALLGVSGAFPTARNPSVIARGFLKWHGSRPANKEVAQNPDKNPNSNLLREKGQGAKVHQPKPVPQIENFLSQGISLHHAPPKSFDLPDYWKTTEVNIPKVLDGPGHSSGNRRIDISIKDKTAAVGQVTHLNPAMDKAAIIYEDLQIMFSLFNSRQPMKSLGRVNFHTDRVSLAMMVEKLPLPKSGDVMVIRREGPGLTPIEKATFDNLLEGQPSSEMLTRVLGESKGVETRKIHTFIVDVKGGYIAPLF